MANRSVRVELLLNATGYMQGIDAASKKTREMGTEAEKLAQKKQSFNVLGTAALGFGAAVGVGIGMAVSKFADFDAQMSAVQAATHETAGNMELLRDAAIDAGARTVYSATEAAMAIEELSKAGISTASILSGALDGALDLAAAGNIEVANAAEIAASAMTQFGLGGRDVSHIADLLAAGAGKAQGGVEDMSQALNQSGLVAAQMGLSLDETVGTLTQFASAGLLGSDAGTSFRNMLLRLANPTKEAATQMENLGLDFYDAQGEFIGMEGVAGQLQTRLKGLTAEERNAALANLFGQDAIRSASILYEGGSEAVREWAEAVDDSGYAAETAATRLDNLKGDWEAFTGALDSAMISMGEGADGPMRFFVQMLTEATNSFNDMPAGAQQAVFWVGAVAGAVALAGGAFLLAVPKVAEYRAAVTDLGPAAQRASRIVGTAMRAITAATVIAVAAEGIDLLSNKIAENFTPSAEEMKNQFRTAKDAAEQLQVGMAAVGGDSWNNIGMGRDAVAQLADVLDDAAKAQSDFWYRGDPKFDLYISGIKQMGDEYATLAKEDLPQAQANFRELTEEAGLNKKQIAALLEEMGPFKDALTGIATEKEMTADKATILALAMGDVSTASGVAGGSVSGASGDIEGMGDAAEIAQDQLDDLRDALDEVGGKARDLGAAQDDAQAAMNGLVEAAAAQDVSLWGTNDASIALRDSLREVEESGRDAATAMLDNGMSVDEATAAYALNREGILNTIQPYFESRDAAIAWADANLGGAGETIQALSDVGSAIQNIPDPAPVRVSVDTSPAMRGIDQFITQNNGRTIRVRVGLDGGSIQMGSITVTPSATGNLFEKGQKVTGFAAGGWSSGVGMARATPGGLLRVAEAGYDEAIISTDPQYRDRSIGILQDMAGRLGMWQQPTTSAVPYAVPQSQSPVQVSLAGAVMTLMVDGNPVRAIVQEQIVAHDDASNAWSRGGTRS